MANPGTYPAKVAQVQMGYTQIGKEQLGIQWQLESGETIWSYHYFSSEKALEITTKALQAIGWCPIGNGWALESINGTDVLVGKEAQLVLEEETYEGKTRVRVRFVNDVNGGGGIANAMSNEDAARFANALRARAGAPGPVASVSQNTTPFDTDDDIPF